MKVPEQDIEQVWRDFISGHGKGDVRAKHVETFVKERYGNLHRRKRGRGKGGKQCENLSVHLGMVLEMANLIRELNIVVEDAAENEHVVDINSVSRLRRQAAAKSLRRLNAQQKIALACAGVAFFDEAMDTAHSVEEWFVPLSEEKRTQGGYGTPCLWIEAGRYPADHSNG